VPTSLRFRSENVSFLLALRASSSSRFRFELSQLHRMAGKEKEEVVPEPTFSHFLAIYSTRKGKRCRACRRCRRAMGQCRALSADGARRGSGSDVVSARNATLERAPLLRPVGVYQIAKRAVLSSTRPIFATVLISPTRHVKVDRALAPFGAEGDGTGQ
jgi:hypothetical protein